MKNFIKKRRHLLKEIHKKQTLTLTFTKKRSKLVQKFDSKLEALIKKTIFNKCNLDSKYTYSIFNRSTFQIFKTDLETSSKTPIFQFSFIKNKETDSYEDITLSLINYFPTSLNEDLEKFILIGKISKFIYQNNIKLIEEINKIYDIYKKDYLNSVGIPMDKNFKDIASLSKQGIELEHNFILNLIKSKGVIKFNPTTLFFPDTETKISNIIQINFTPIDSFHYKLYVKTSDLDTNNCNIVYELETEDIEDFVKNYLHFFLQRIKGFEE